MELDAVKLQHIPEIGHVRSSPGKAVHRLRKDDLELAALGILEHLLVAQAAAHRLPGNLVVNILADDFPTLCCCMHVAAVALVLQRTRAAKFVRPAEIEYDFRHDASPPCTRKMSAQTAPRSK